MSKPVLILGKYETHNKTYKSWMLVNNFSFVTITEQQIVLGDM